MSEPTLVLLSAVVAAFMVTLLRHGAPAELRAAIRTTFVVVLGWGLAYSHYGFKSWSAIPSTEVGMLLVSTTAVVFAWVFYFRTIRMRPPLSGAITDRVNVGFAVLFATLYLCQNFSAQATLWMAIMVAGALVLAMGSR